ncbi:MAG TPA: fused MFS/spermidine synthase [Vicinamibacterales bacterium]
MSRTCSVLLFCSGAAALVYQILWIKQLSLIVGVDVYAVTIAVSAFFVGLGAGSAVFGRMVDGTGRPFRLYALLEGATAVAGVLATLLLAHAAGTFAVLQDRVGIVAWLAPFALVGIPACLMGGTLPVVVRVAADEDVAQRGGSLYAANTCGAMFGVAASTFYLIPHFGVTGSAIAAAAINAAAGLAALALDKPRAAPVAATPKTAKPSKPRDAAKDRLAALVLYALAGAIALGYEVVWSQVLVQFMSTRTFAFSVVLITYLGGLALGSALHARQLGRRDPWITFGVLVGGAGFLALALVASIGTPVMTAQSNVEELLRRLTGNELTAMLGRFAVAAGALVLLPTIALGAAFPAALRLAAGSHVGRDVGDVVAWNTVGGVVGTLVVGFGILPALGLVHTLAVLAMAAAAVGIVAMGRASRGAAGRPAMYVIAAGTLVAAAATPADRLAQLLPTTRGGGEVVFYSEGAAGTVAVVTQPGPRRFNRLYIQGVSNSGDAMPSLRYMRLQALLPLIIHRGEPRSALVIGFGTGITAGATGRYQGLERRVCAELLPAVVAAGSMFHGNFNAQADPTLEIRLRDGRRELLRSGERYDLITLEPPPPSAAGIVNLYSRDFYQLARARLQPNGIVAQWWPLATQNDEDSRGLVRSFLDAFPYVSLWTTEVHEMMLVGSPEPMELNVERIAQRFNQPEVSAALREVGVGSPEALLATWIAGREGLEQYAASARAVTDDWPSIEYAGWVRRGEFGRVLPEVLALRMPAPLVAAAPDFAIQLRVDREALLQFYQSGLAAYRGDREGWERALRNAMRLNPENPYFRWIAGEGG